MSTETDQIRTYREKAGELAAQKIASFRNQVAELKRDGRNPQLLYAAMLERYIDLFEYFFGGHTDALSEQENEQFQWEFTELADWIFVSPTRYDEIIVERLIGEMQNSGLSEEIRIRERKIALAKRRGTLRTWGSLEETFTAAALRLEGKEFSEIADIMCANKSHRPHWNRGRRARKDSCVSRLDQRVNPLLNFLKKCGYEISHS